MDNRPIGIFDSGIGGLTVAKEIVNALPDEEICYIGDTKRAPYGMLPQDTMIVYSREIIKRLLRLDVKAIVVACNTVSSVCMDALRREFKTLFFGMIEPGVYAALETARRTVCLMATKATVDSGAHKHMLHSMNSSLAFCATACPAFVPLIEAGLGDSTEAHIAAGQAFARVSAHKPDTLILGCTHYPLMETAIGAAAGKGVAIVNPAQKAAAILKNALAKYDLLCASRRAPAHRLYVTGRSDVFANTLHRLELRHCPLDTLHL